MDILVIFGLSPSRDPLPLSSSSSDNEVEAVIEEDREGQQLWAGSCSGVNRRKAKGSEA
jgi:hypothetical protein